MLAALGAALLSAVPASAQTTPTSDCTVRYGTNNAAGSGQLPSLKVYGSGETQIWSGTSYSSGATSPAFACSSSRAVVFEMTKSNGHQYRTGGSAWTMQFADGATLRRDGANNFFFKAPAGFSGTYTLKGAVTVTSDPNSSFVYTGTSFDADDYRTGSTMAITQGGTTQPGVDQFEYVIQVTVVAAPTISGFSPTTGPTTGGGSLTISGANFSATGNGVTIGGTNAPITAQSATSITVTIPNGVAGSRAVVVTTSAADGSQSATASASYVYVTPPAVTNVAPAAGPPSGGVQGTNSVQIVGTNLNGATSVKFGAASALSFVVSSATEIVAAAPAGSGAVNVTVTTDGGTSQTGAGNRYVYAASLTNAVAVGTSPITTGGTSQLTFTVSNPAGNPTVTGISSTVTLPGGVVVAATPAASTTCTGANVVATAGGSTIALANGSSLAAGASCTFTAAVTSNAPTTYTISSGAADSTQTDPGAATTASLVVSNPTPPSVSSIAPAGGSTGGGTPVTITGTGFISGNAYTATFGATSVAATYVSATALTATSPAGAGTVQVAVTNTTTQQVGTGSAGYAYAAPTVTGLSATAGPANQQRPTVVVTGTNFTPTMTVSIGGTAVAAFAYNSASQATVTLPAKPAGTYDVQVTTGAVTSAANPPGDQYAYVAAPTVTSVSPSSGSTSGGTTVTIGGSNLSGATAVTIGGNPATNVVVAGDGNSLTASTPAGSAGAATVAVTTPGGIGQLAGGYTYVVLSPPSVTTQPADQTVPVGATASFNAAASGSPAPTVQWQVSTDGTTFTNAPGSSTGTSYTTPATAAGDDGKQYRAVFDNGQGTATTSVAKLTVVRPPSADGQSVAVAYQTATPVTLTATDPNTPARTITGYTIGAQPQHGSISGGTAANRTYTPAAGYSGPDSFTFTASNGIAVSAPATVSIHVQQPLPVVSGVTPNEGPTAGGTAITVAGSGFTGATAVTVGGSAATGVTVVSDTQITATTPGGTIGGASVVVTNATGGSAANALFTFVGAPTANGQSVATGNGAARPITLTGSDPNAPARTLTYAIVNVPQHGTLSGTTPNLTYTPTGNFSGSDSFTFTVSNGTSTSSAATVTIAVATPITLSPATLADGTVAQSYSQAITGSGGAGSYTYAVTQGALPAGLTLSGGGAISGTPTAGGAYSFRITATDAGGYSGYRDYSVTIAAATIVIAPPTLPDAPRNVNYSQTVSASGGTGTYSFAVTAGALPAGLTLAADGTLAGRPTVAGSYSFTVTATDSSGGSGPYSGTRGYTLAVTAVPIAIAPPTLPAATTRVAYSQTITASGGAASYSYAVTAGALPAGFTLSTGGTLSGTANAAGSYNFTITATDANGNAGTRGYSLTVTAPTIAIAPGTLPAATTRLGYSQALTASGGTASYGFAVTAGALPAGFTLSTGGTLAGTTTAAGSYNFTVTATDANGNAGSQGYTLTVAAPTIAIAPATLPTATTRVGYSQALTASGGTGSYGFAVTAGALPAGVTLSTGGTLSGTATAAGSYNFTVTATDANGNAGSQGYTLTVAAPTIAIAPNALPTATTRVAYSQALTAGGGTAPYSFAVTAGALPGGITLSTSGALSGTANAAGTSSFTVTATDANGNAGTKGYSLVVAAPTVTVTPSTLSGAQVGVAYGATIGASGGTAPYGFAVTAGALPAGLTLASSGALAGTPTSGGSFSFTITGTDADGNAGAQGYTLNVASPAIALAPAALPGATRNTAYSQSVSASGGVAPYSFAVTAGALPAGLTLSTGGTLSGTPTAQGTFNFTISATDSSTGGGPYVGTRSYSLSVASPTITLSPATLANGTVGTAFSAALSAGGGTAPYQFSVTSGALPTGVTLGGGGTLSGTPSAAGSFAFSVTATDTNGNAGLQGYTLTIGKATQAIMFPNPGTRRLSDGTVALSATTGSGLAVAFTSTTTGTCTVSGGTVTLLQVGTCSIAADQAGDANYDPAPTVTQSFTVSAAALVAAQAQANVAGTVGTALSPVAPVTASGGTAPYGFSLSGTLPAGLSFATGTGVVSGTPTAGRAATNYTVTVSDSSGQSASATFGLAIAAPTLSVTPASLANGAYQTAYSQQLSVSGGTAPYRFAVTSGALPGGLTLSQGGLLAGVPTAGGSFSFTVTATDASTGSGPYSATRDYVLAISLPPPPVAQTQSQPVATTSTTTAGRPVAIDLSALVTGTYDSIQITTRPLHGTVELVRRPQSAASDGSRFTAEYVPVAGFAGSDAFGFVAVGPGGRSAEATVSITVQGTVPVAPAVRGTTMSAQPVLIDLTAGASGGPFTGARIVSVAPADAVAAELIEGGTAASRTYQLRVTPGGRFSGTATVQYTLSNAFGASAPSAATVTVAARPDPSQDATVRGMVTAQADATRRFASSQTDNFMRRTEQLHGDGSASRGSEMGVRVNLSGLPMGSGLRQPVASESDSDVARLTLGHALAVDGAERASGRLGALGQGLDATGLAAARGRGAVARGAAAGDAAAANGSGSTGEDGAGGRKIGSVSAWTGGAIQVGVRDETTRRAKLSVSSGGLSAGLDVKLADWITVGVGGGYGADRTRIGGRDGRLEADTKVGVGYASLAPAKGVFIDGLLGAGDLSFDTRRTITFTGATALGRRDGSMVFGSLAAGIDRTTSDWSLSAYGRLDYFGARLDAYEETGGGLYGLTFAKRDLDSLASVVGFRGAYGFGPWTPRARFEWRHDFNAADAQRLEYAGLVGFGYRIDDAGWLRDSFAGEVGTELRSGIWHFGIDVGGQVAQKSRAVTVKGTVGAQF